MKMNVEDKSGEGDRQRGVDRIESDMNIAGVNRRIRDL